VDDVDLPGSSPQTQRHMAVEFSSECSARDVANDDTLRSQLMRALIADVHDLASKPSAGIPRLILQFWDDASAVPLDVQICLDTWRALEDSGFERIVFDDVTARNFIADALGSGATRAFDCCHHPAMRADYFRLCFMAERGGFYVDADDVYFGTPLEHLFEDDRLKLQPLCYDVATDSMVDPVSSAQAQGDSENGRTFYVNNNPIIAPPRHPVIRAALERATHQLLTTNVESRDVQGLTGPGNLTAVLVEHALDQSRAGHEFDFLLLKNWESTARSEWPLAYRSDARNWRQWVRGEGGRL